MHRFVKIFNRTPVAGHAQFKNHYLVIYFVIDNILYFITPAGA